MALFDDTEAQARYETVAPIADAYEQATRLWAQVSNHDPLSETMDALNRIPDAIRPQVEDVAKALFRNEFITLAAARFSVSEQARDPAFSLHVMTHSAKLAVFSAVGYLAASPWHLADAALLKRIGSDLQGAQNLDAAQKRFQSVQCMNLFVAALETDDRDSYLKSVKGLVLRHKVHNLVFDDELIEWRPEAEFVAACNEVGMRPMHVGIADRRAVTKHSMLRPETTPQRIPALYVDTQGRQLQLSESGEVRLPEPDQSTPVAAPAPAARQAAKPIVPAPESTAGTAPSSTMQSRIQNLRAQQARRTARP